MGEVPGPGGVEAARHEQRDRLAELWLTSQHTSRWYIGDATEAQWDAAYAAVDAGWAGPAACRGNGECTC